MRSNTSIANDRQELLEGKGEDGVLCFLLAGFFFDANRKNGGKMRSLREDIKWKMTDL